MNKYRNKVTEAVSAIKGIKMSLVMRRNRPATVVPPPPPVPPVVIPPPPPVVVDVPPPPAVTISCVGATEVIDFITTQYTLDGNALNHLDTYHSIEVNNQVFNSNNANNIIWKTYTLNNGDSLTVSVNSVGGGLVTMSTNRYNRPPYVIKFIPPRNPELNHIYGVVKRTNPTLMYDSANRGFSGCIIPVMAS